MVPVKHERLIERKIIRAGSKLMRSRFPLYAYSVAGLTMFVGAGNILLSVAAYAFGGK